MDEIKSWIDGLQRPRLLLQAARLGLRDYNRKRKHARLSADASNRSPKARLDALIPVEEGLEVARQNGDASYVPSRHVEVMTALLAEIGALRRAQV